jgi:hypothetical protein
VEAWNLAGCSLLQMPLPQIWQLDPLLKQSNVSKAIFKSNKKNLRSISLAFLWLVSTINPDGWFTTLLY